MDASSLDQLSGAAGNAVGVQLLKQAQDLAQSQAAQLVQSLPQPPSPQGVGENLDLSV